MNTLTASSDYAGFAALYAPENIARFVSSDLRRMYLGTAPTLAQVAAVFGPDKYRKWIAGMIKFIIDFAGLSERFDISQMTSLAEIILTRFPALKVTEVMHFVYLCQCGDYESFYGNPSGRALLGLMTRYVRTDRERILASYRDDIGRDSELARPRAELSPQEAAVVTEVLAAMADPDFRARNGGWRYEPGADILARAYFVDRTLATFPGDMSPPARRRFLSRQ